MNKLSPQERAQVLNCLVEGNSIRATVRLTGVAKNTVTKLLVDVGKACREYQDKALRNLPCKRVQVDEVWAFCYAKQKNLPPEKAGQFGYGDMWTWTAICADTKLVPSWMVGNRDAEWASAFMNDLAGRLVDRVQLTSDGHRPYLQAVAGAFGNEIDYAMLDKLYGMPGGYEGKYSPAKCLGSRKRVVSGEPDPMLISTSYAERQNLTMRMQMRRFTRLTNAFSKKVENLDAAVSLYFMHYNFCRVHQTTRVTPAMAAGVTDRVWGLGDVSALVADEAPQKRGPYKKRISN